MKLQDRLHVSHVSMIAFHFRLRVRSRVRLAFVLDTRKLKGNMSGALRRMALSTGVSGQQMTPAPGTAAPTGI